MGAVVGVVLLALGAVVVVVLAVVVLAWAVVTASVLDGAVEPVEVVTDGAGMVVGGTVVLAAVVVLASVVVVVTAVVVDPVAPAGVTNCTRVVAGPWVAITATVAAPARRAPPIAIRIRALVMS